jgi:hypothetical protein
MIFPKPSRKAVTWLFVAVLSLALFTALASAYQRTEKATTEISVGIMTAVGNIITQRTASLLGSTEALLQTDVTMTQPVIQTPLPDTQAYWFPLFWKQLELNPSISAIYIADTQGNFAKAERLPRWATLVVDTRSGKPVNNHVYRQADFSPLAHTETPGQYDPRTRPWYTNAKNGKAGTVYWSDLYPFATVKGMGITASIPFFDGQGKLAGVLGADITLQGLNDFFSGQPLGEHDVTLVINSKGELVSYPVRVKLTEAAETAQANGKLPTLDMIHPDQAWIAQAYQWQQQKTQQQAQYFPFEGENYIPVLLDFPVQIADWKLLVIAPESDLLRGANRSIAENITLSVFALLLFGFILYVVFGKPFRLENNV